MAEMRRVYGVRNRSRDTERLKFCCDFETEEQFSDRFDVFHIDIGSVDLKQGIEPFFTKLIDHSQTKDWELFRFRVPERETDTEVLFSDGKQLAIFDEFEESPHNMGTKDSDELMAVCERKATEKARTIEVAVSKFLNRKLGSGGSR
jgi:hypothetical protein